MLNIFKAYNSVPMGLFFFFLSFFFVAKWIVILSILQDLVPVNLNAGGLSGEPNQYHVRYRITDAATVVMCVRCRYMSKFGYRLTRRVFE
ncbi:hypothetical protein BDV40DRAFT_274815 [Aspergillus tamarii]|uniref:Uncharacterized protein n=1 Tax=Aspergillus tamarii TaxID=41984 RepID=A0A5N6UJP3_ASPTM|nr:hypothetical protein BDV40DRAFT_274815 [Aspergillus tamarii]